PPWQKACWWTTQTHTESLGAVDRPRVAQGRYAARRHPYGQNIRTRFPTGGYTSITVPTSACLPPHYHGYSPPRGTVQAEGGGDGLETSAGVYHGDRRSGTAVTQ